MKLWNVITSLTVSLLIFSGCGGVKPTPSTKTIIDSTLPIVALTRNGVIADMKSIAFEWESTKNPKVKGIFVYKKYPKNKLLYYKTINNRFKTHFIDTDVLPNTKYTYTFCTFTKEAQSVMSKEITVVSLPVLESVSWIHSITGMPRTAKIIWRPHNNQKVKEYIIERKTLTDKEWKKIDVVPGRLNAEYIDEDLKDNFIYMYRIRVATFDEIVSTPSQSVKVITKALPLSVNNIKATINLPRKIKLVWDATTQKDFSLYYVYRSESLNGTYSLIATLHNNTYINKIEEDAKVYFYRVSVVDKDALESIHDKNSIEGMTLIKPKTPIMTKATLSHGRITIEWKNIDNRIQSYILVKTHKKGWFDKTVTKIKDIVNPIYIEKNVQADSTYTYVIYGVDLYKIESEPSIEVKIVVPESKKIIQAKKSKKVQEQQVAVQKESSKVIVNSDNLDLSGL